VSVLPELFAIIRTRAHQMIMATAAHILPLIKLTTVLLPVYQIVLQVEERSKVMGIWTRPNGSMAGMIPESRFSMLPPPEDWLTNLAQAQEPRYYYPECSGRG